MTIKQQGGVFGRNPSFNDVTAIDVISNTMETKSLFVGDNAEAATSPLRVLKKANGTAALEWAGGKASVVYADLYMNASENLSLRLDPTNALSNSYFEITHNGDALATFTGATGDLTVHNGNLVIGTSGKGIDFSATAGTGTSELFDDYEEGTFTPVAADASSGGNEAAGGTFTGHYVKVGNVVTAVASLFNVNTTGMTSGNDLYITGLPFTSKTSTGGVIYTGSVVMASTTTSGNNVTFINAGDAVARVAENVSGGNADFITVGELSSGTADVRITITYPTE